MTTRMSTPRSSMNEAAACRRSWMRTRRTWARSQSEWNDRRTLRGSSGVPTPVVNTSASSADAARRDPSPSTRPVSSDAWCPWQWLSQTLRLMRLPTAEPCSPGAGVHRDSWAASRFLDAGRRRRDRRHRPRPGMRMRLRVHARTLPAWRQRFGCRRRQGRGRQPLLPVAAGRSARSSRRPSRRWRRLSSGARRRRP